MSFVLFVVKKKLEPVVALNVASAPCQTSTISRRMKYKGILLDFYGTCVAEDDAFIERIILTISRTQGTGQ